ncbi:hypothetical protein SPRG_05541 [Saprolegnia parasitica CBS 223.65]|uniref:Ricin B lectin domain-containing protein n=1 Tax=Saprolegnia parasitica (strain CBS 223.65) TaxID=695850 RepID=A0A067CK63_SAPPC|nr:hypothetical protein SPRG_05541 [Saprolegnia parasitica CBS 223.65]KDO29585.1 hypothetical protein SPRG_05541 [Saprolegnia parasitica CBS 223.65]|eukprot:XP_012199649.1 hypothetical protein SPRG_05541 [Saprolegnia parasitica CBS 223.65]
MQLASLLGFVALARAVARDACTPTTPEPTTPAQTTPAPVSICQTLVDGKKIYLAQMVGSTKNYLGYCVGCKLDAYSYKLPARVNKWWHPITISTIPGGSLGLQMDTGRFYSRCENCGNAANQVVQRYTKWQASVSTHWTCEDVSETHIRLKDFKGEYMTRREYFRPLDGHIVYSSSLNATDDGQLWTVDLTAP